MATTIGKGLRYAAMMGVAGTLLLCGGVARAQSAGSTSIQQQTGPSRGPGMGIDHGPSLAPEIEEKAAKARNDQRQKQLVDDTAKLLELATQLKEDVDKTNKNILSIDVIKRAEQIEKLAHAVKERMKG